MAAPISTSAGKWTRSITRDQPTPAAHRNNGRAYAGQLEASKAALMAAESALENARLDLARTAVTAPFNAVVLSRHVNLGSQATLQGALARLAGTDAY